ADLGHVELLDRGDQTGEGLVEARQGLAGAGQGRGPRQDVVLHERVAYATLLDLRHYFAEGGVGLAHALRARLALGQGLREGPAQERVHPPQDGGEGPAREAPVRLVEQSQGDEVRRLELEGVILLAAAGLALRQAAV